MLTKKRETSIVEADALLPTSLESSESGLSMTQQQQRTRPTVPENPDKFRLCVYTPSV